MSILLFIAGLVVYFVTAYDTLGIVIAVVGGVLFLLQLAWFVFVANKVRQGFKETNTFRTNFGRTRNF